MILEKNPGMLNRLRIELYRIRKRRALTLWMRMLTRHQGVLPTFLIIGAQRCGTTSLFRYLSQNPALSPSMKKEVHFFDSNFSRGLDWYKAYFDKAQPGGRLITFDGTPSMFLPHTERRTSQVLPDARLIVLLRNPINRAYSHYKYHVNDGRDGRTFEEAIAEEPEIVSADLKRMQDDPSYISKRVWYGTNLLRGVYIDQLLRWERYFRRDQMLILLSEDFYADPPGALRQIAEFVGFPHHEPPQFKRFLETSGPPVNPDTRAQLIEYYRGHNARLSEYLGRNLDWDR